MQLIANAEGGAEDATVAAAQAGSGTPWDTVVGTPTITYDNEHAYHLRAYKIVGAGTAQQMVWTSTSVGTAAELWGRFYLWSNAAPSLATGLLRFTVGGSQTARLRYDADGKLVIADAGNGAKITTVSAIPTGQWIRVEWHIIFLASSTGTCELRTYNNPESSTATESLSSSTLNALVNCDRVEAGSFNNTSWTGWMDAIEVNDTGWPGPLHSARPPAALRHHRHLLVR